MGKGERMIKIGDCPERTKGVNKFIAKPPCNEGLRGVIIALHKSKKEAIILAKNSTLDNKTVKWGSLYLVREPNSTSYPIVIKQVSVIPNKKEWTVLK